jgi:hypothetical protein
MHPYSRTSIHPRALRGVRSLWLFLLCLYVPALAAPLPAQPKETAKYGVYLLSQRVGSLLTQTFDATHVGKPAVRQMAEMDMKLTILGASTEQRMELSYLLTPTGKPLTTRLVMTSLGRTTTVDARYEPDRVLCYVDAGGQKSTKTVAIPKGVTLVGDPELSGSPVKDLKPGQKESMHFFDPLTMTIQKVEMEVLKSETRTVAGKPVQAFLVKSVNSMSGESQTWVDVKGRMLENESKLGLRLVREDLLAAPSTLAYDPPKDFAVATSVRTAVKLPDPRRTRLLRLKISSLPDEALVLGDTRQRVVTREKSGGRVTATYLIQSRDFPPTARPVAAPSAKGESLGDAPYLGVSDPSIRKQAQELAGGEKDRAVIARRVRAWVRGHMTKLSNVGTPRGAPEIMRSRDGVCRDYATLFAAVARAAGVPTRLCAGIVYFQDGFFYHAWVECRLTDGEDGWYAFDPTLDDDFVDATHVKFAQGDPTDMFAATRAVGEIQAEILDHK